MFHIEAAGADTVEVEKRSERSQEVFGFSLHTNSDFSCEIAPIIPAKSATKINQDRNENRGRRGRPRQYATNAEKFRVFHQRQKQRSILPTLPEGPYRIIYADPPWQYSNDGLQKYGHAGFYYPTLTLEQLCLLHVKGIVERHAVLFLWVTSRAVRWTRWRRSAQKLNKFVQFSKGCGEAGKRIEVHRVLARRFCG